MNNSSHERENGACFELLLPDHINNYNEENSNNNTSNLKVDHDEDFLKKKTQELVDNRILNRVVKTLIFLVVVMGVVFGRTYGLPRHPVECLNDPLHNIFGYFNHLVNTNVYAAGFFQISNSIVMDLTFFTLYIYWIFYVKSCRLVLTCIFFYSLRAFCQILVQMRYPPGIYWDDPGFPSLIVPYGDTTDFFYSGHVGFLNIAALEWYKQKIYKMTYLTVFVMFYTIFVLLIFRAHYSIDIITGLIASNWIFTHIDIHHEYLNRLFSRAYQKMIRTYISKKYSNGEK